MMNFATPSGRFSLRLNDGHAELVTEAFSLQDTATINDDRWHHIVGSYDGQSLKLWVDQRLAVERTGVTIRSGGSGSVFVGDVSNYSTTEHEPFVGELDDGRMVFASMQPDAIERHRAVRWSHSTERTTAGGTSRSLDEGRAGEVEATAAGESFVVHTFERGLGIDGVTRIATRAGSSVSMFSAAGSRRWTTTLSSSDADGAVVVRRIVAVGSDVVVAATASRGNVLVNGTSIGAANDSDTPVLMRLSGTDGRVRWWQVYARGGSAELRGLSSIDASTLVAGGRFEGTHEFGSATLTSAGAADLFVLRIDANDGSVRSAFRAGGAADERLAAVASVDASVVLVGTYGGAASDLGGAALANPGAHRWGFVARLASDGSHQFSTSLSARGDARPLDVRSSSAGYVVAGEFDQSLSLLSRTHSGNPTGSTPFVASFDAVNDSVSWTSVIEDSLAVAFAPRIVVNSSRVSLLIRTHVSDSSPLSRIGQTFVAMPGTLTVVDLARSTGAPIRSEVVATDRAAIPNAIASLPDGSRIVKVDHQERLTINGYTIGTGLPTQSVLRLVF
jgi:hypothetical protein